MTILWIPHSPFQPGSVRRDQHLIRHLKDRHRIISVTWETRESSLVRTVVEGLRFYEDTLEDGRAEYHVRRVPDFTRRLRGNTHDSFWINQALFRRDIRRIVEKENVDVLITAYSKHMTGLPPFDLGIPIIFDYLDCAEWQSEDPDVKPYLERSDLTLAVSSLAEEQARRLSSNVVYLPNGADVKEIRGATGKEVIQRYGLEDATVVSMVGLIDSPYFVEAVLRAKEEVPNLKCLLVGESSYLQSSIVASGSGADAFIDVGAVPYREVAGYLAASDVGTYPVPGTSYDDGRSPIKIFEYTAAGCSVVSPPIREVRRLNFSNVVYAEANAKSFADGIIRACRTSPPQEETIEDYDWHNLAKKLEHSAQPMI